MSTDTEAFFTDAPLRHEMDGWRAQWALRAAIEKRWARHVVDSVNGHLVWRVETDRQPDAGRVFYGGDYSDILAPDDTRLLTPRAEEPSPDCIPRQLRPDWDETASEVSSN